MYELYEQLMLNYKDERLFTASVINWLDNAKENPFEENTIERQLFFKAKRYNSKWRAGGIDMRSAKRNMIQTAKEMMERRIPNPYTKEEPKTPAQAMVEPVSEEPAEITKEELSNDVNYLMACMVNEYNRSDNASYEMYVLHLMDVAKENPFAENTNEYNLFAEMFENYHKTPSNKRRTFVVGKQLCELINNTELYPEKIKTKTVLGVLPEQEEKKNWLSFLFPWKKDGETNDSTRTD